MMSKDSDSKVKLGHGKLARSIVRRLERHYEKDEDLGVENSLVVGIFGEWGSGKSTLLNEIGAQFEKLSEGDLLSERSTVTVPVRFNPWRYEKESHLIVPLLKVTQATLKKHLDSIEKEEESFWQHLRLEGYVFSFSSLPSLSSDKEIARENKRNRIVSVLKKASRLFGISAISMTSMIKLKAGLPGFGSIEFSGKDAADSAKSLMDMVDSRGKKNRKLAAIEALESHYYAFESGLKDITRPTSSGNARKEKLNFLFLIDDLDRCLPEKAVEMLESIKLFLDVPGCAFAIALDDEVVERGIQHRYRDYIFEQHRNGHCNNGDHAPPITGAEYLEKIIQLPFRLPLPTEDQLKELLKNRFPNMLGDIRIGFDSEGRSVYTGRYLKARGVVGDNGKAERVLGNIQSPLLLFLMAVVPWVPRKLIRAAELVQLTQSLTRDRSLNNIDEIALARYIVLQLFAPQLYRYTRVHFKDIFRLLKQWKDDFPNDWRRNDFPEQLYLLIVGDYEKCNLQRELDITTKKNFKLYRSVWGKILKMIIEVRNGRMDFDPMALVAMDDDYGETFLVHKYFCLSDELTSTSRGVRKYQKLSSENSSLDEFVDVVEINNDEFIDQLFGSDESIWRSALARDYLQGKMIGEITFEAIIARLIEEKDKKNFAMNIDWLVNLSKYIDSFQLQRIYEETGLLEQLKNKRNA